MYFVFRFLSFCLFLNCVYANSVYFDESKDLRHDENQNNQPNHLDVTLIGANGDLSKKYLWKGLFNLYSKYVYNYRDNQKKDWNFALYGAGRDNTSFGKSLLKKNIEVHVLCSADDQRCINAKTSFAAHIKFVQLKTDGDYAKHCSRLYEEQRDKFCYKGQNCEYQHIVYLSIPPFAYEDTAQRISSYCKQYLKEGELKVVLEKPFGHDENSAVSQIKSISQYLDNDQIYRVDHYLGKQAVETIQPFFQTNKELLNMMNASFVDRIEIVMKETLDVKGRAIYYDNYGVICDVMQNHLFEIMCLLTMEISDKLNFNHHKTKLIQELYPVKESNIVLGQYEGYNDEFQSEAQSEDRTKTPTYAGVKLQINSSRWENVPIFIVAGKKLDERVGYSRIVFEDFYFKTIENECPSQPELIFYIGNGILKCPAVLVSKQLPISQNYIPSGWVKTKQFSHLHLFGKPLKCFFVFVPEVIRDAYSFLIEQIFLGHKKHFVATDNLLESWKIWGQIVKETKDTHPLIYSSPEELDFVHVNGILQYQSKYFKPIEKETSVFLKNTLISGLSHNLIAELAEHIQAVAKDAVKQRSVFHIAFSGGSTPIKLFKYLRENVNHNFPWKQTHIWQVDERCSDNPTESNFITLCKEFIDFMPDLKYLNIHPFPVELNGKCGKSNALEYEESMIKYLGKSLQLDYVVLGLGSDGHTASLFPYHETAVHNDGYVTIVRNASPNLSSPNRITLTYQALNTARHISVLVTGHSKCDTVQALHLSGCKDTVKYPICNVVNTNLIWFIDNNCIENE